MARKLLFVGRDGALVERAARGAVDSLEDLRLMPGVIPALLRLVAAGYELVVLPDDAGANGAGRARADAYLEALLASQGIGLTASRRCPHAVGKDCDCTKPGLGLVRGYLTGNAMDRERSAVVGDSEADLELAANMGLPGFRLGVAGNAPAEPSRAAAATSHAGAATLRAEAAIMRAEAATITASATGSAVTSWADVAHALLDRPRVARLRRKTRETDIEVEVDLDRESDPRIETGIGFFDHMLEQLGKHAGIALAVACRGDLQIDEHHTVEDVALALGQALKQALGDKRGIGRYGFVLPMDEAEARVSLDLGGRPYCVFEGTFPRDRVGGLPTELVPHFFRSLAESLGAAVHVELHGENTHHMVEAAFKGLARSLRQACARAGDTLPTTKGLL